jgi:glycosyltransferase involved in cell wall biosynthesis
VRDVPTVSVIVTIYNITDLFGRCVAGLWAQNYPADKTEIIVADDGSIDNWRSVLPNLELKFKTQVVTQQHHGYRLASLKNLGMRASTGEVILFLDGDMIPPPHWMNAHVTALQTNSILTVSIGARRFIDSRDLGVSDILSDPHIVSRLPDVRSISNWLQLEDRRIPELRRLTNHPAPYHLFHGCNAAFFRALALRSGLMDEVFNGYWGYEDTEFAYRMWRGGGQFKWSTDATAYHQENEITALSDRNYGDQNNFELACRLIPGFREFKLRLRDSRRVPWW